MSLLFFSGFETGDFSEWQSISGEGDISTPPTVQSTIKKTGTYAARCNSVAKASSFQSVDYISKRLSFWFYITSLPLPGDDWVHIVNRSGMNHRCGCKINSDGQILLALGSHDEVIDYWNSDFHLSEGQWYRICICTQWNPVSETGKDRLYVDGILVCSDDDSYTTGIGFDLGFGTRVYVGPPDIWPTGDIYFDDIVYDDDESLEDIGDIRVLRAGITGAGEYAEFDSEVGSATHYENVDELSYSDDDYNYDTTDNPGKESYALENCSAIGLLETDVIKAVRTLCRMKTSSGGKASKYYILRRDNEVDYEELVTVGTSFDSEGYIDNSMPNGEGDWTQGRFDALEVGMYSDGSGARDPYLSNVSVMVAFGEFVEEEEEEAEPALLASAVNQPIGVLWGW